MSRRLHCDELLASSAWLSPSAPSPVPSAWPLAGTLLGGFVPSSEMGQPLFRRGRVLYNWQIDYTGGVPVRHLATVE